MNLLLLFLDFLWMKFSISLGKQIKFGWPSLGTMNLLLKNFLQDCWEVSPLLIKGSANNFDDKSSIFSSLRNSLGCRMNANALAMFLGQLVSCPPIASDELDIFSFLKEVDNSLGSPMTYENDIRVVKTPKFTSESIQHAVKEEIHFFKHFMDSELVEKFSFVKSQEALQDGYTIALRGMAFRIVEVAAIASGLSNLFGQPSVGANIYLTPPSSQGLAKHFDDHCVFVCQLFGQKRWRISPRQVAFLPRLYEPLCGLPSSKYEDDGCMDVLLREGDILYIPRGYPHEAHTIGDSKEHDNKSSSEFSMHLTLGIEVEPPFEWEGFTHIALHLWNQKYKKYSAYPIDHGMQNQRSMLVNMLHITLRLIADKNVVLKKACMVAALPFSSNTNCYGEHILLLRQKTTFDYIIETIDNSSSFSETLLYITTTVHEGNENSLQWMRWLRHLCQEEEEKEAFDKPLELLKEFLLLNSNHIKEVAKEFTEMKSEFCGSVFFEDVCDEYKMLLQKYKKTRKQYMNGMLSLHTCFL
ncbi:hypothetical protein HPP92_010780 [Vanilla planifolia]|uniref:Bifunctional lysine-specific demethylase and histidyl-hydroxylase n=1 Tax=Vanilla planifolia TaxID=51239 RepID=A0A835R5V4_VANPL|nr:hypothetical protein HPP92_010780 [Vanilla planifolia]